MSIRSWRSWLILSLAACTSCAAHRRLTVASEPAGATLRIDDRVVGPTPYIEEFFDYGSRRITLYAEGYHSRSEVVRLEPPWYARFPIDILSEILIPWGWEDPHALLMRLEPVKGTVTEPDLTPVLERAQALRLAGPEGPSQLPPRQQTRPAPAQRP